MAEPVRPRARSALAAAEISLYPSVLADQGAPRPGAPRHRVLRLRDHHPVVVQRRRLVPRRVHHEAGRAARRVPAGRARRADRWTRPCTCATSSRSIVDRRPFMLDLNRDADPEVYRAPRPHHDRQAARVPDDHHLQQLRHEPAGGRGGRGRPSRPRCAELGIDGVKVLRGVEDQAAFEAGLNNEVTANGLLKLLRADRGGQGLSPEALRPRCWRSCSTSATRAASRPACPRGRARGPQDRQHLHRPPRRGHRVPRGPASPTCW